MGQLRLLGEPTSSDDHAALTNLAYATAAHTGFCALAGSQTITGEKLIDSAVGLRFGHAAGPLLQAPASGDDLTLTGDLKVSGNAALAGGTPSASVGLLIQPASISGFGAYYGARIDLPVGDGTPVNNVSGVLINSTAVLASGRVFKYLQSGLVAMALAPAAVAGTIQGLDFAPRVSVPLGATLSVLTGAKVGVYTGASQGTVTTVRGLHVANVSLVGNPGPVGTSVGVDVEDFGGPAVNLAIGLRIADFNYGTTRYLIEAGPATPYLRLLAGAAPGANLTNLYLAEGAAPTLRRVQWVDPGAGGANLVAGQRVLVLV